MKPQSEDTVHQTMKNSEPWDTGNKQSELNPTSALPSSLYGKSFQAVVQEGGIMAEPAKLPELRICRSRNQVETIVLMAEYWRKEMYRDKTPKIYRHSPLSLHLGTEQCMCVKKLPETEIETLKRLERTISEDHMGQEFTYCHQPK